MFDTTLRKEDHYEILIVSDSPEDLELLYQILAERGYKVRSSPSGHLALQSVSLKLPDLILIDIKMTDISGYEVCRKLKSIESSKGIPVLFISEFHETLNKVEGFDAGGVDYISKPFDRDEVLARVKVHLRLHELTERLEQQVHQRTEELRKSNQLHFLETLEQINDAIRQGATLDNILNTIMSVALSAFSCDRAWIFPTNSPMEEVKFASAINPQFPGLESQDVELEPPGPGELQEISELRSTNDPITYVNGTDHPVLNENAQRHHVQSQIVMALRPQIGGLFIFGLHQCSHAREWTSLEIALFRQIGQRLGDYLNSWLAHKELMISEERFRAVADYTYDWETWFNHQGNAEWINPAVERISGYGVDECFAMENYPLPIVHENDRLLVADIINDAKRGTSGNDKPFRIIEKTGKMRWLAISWQPIFNKEGKTLGFRTSIRDITERRLAEEKIRESENRYRLLFDSIDDAVFVYKLIDDQGTVGRFLDMNETACKRYGYSREEFLQMTPDDLDAEDQSDQLPRITKKLAAQQQIVFETVHVTKGGTRIPVEIGTTIITLDGERMVYAIARDITERKRAEESLKSAYGQLEDKVMERTAELAVAREEAETARILAEKANDAKSDFLARMSHDIRTPLNAVTGLTNIVLKSELTAEQRDYLNKIQLAGSNLLLVIDDILDFSKVEAGQLDIEQHPFSNSTNRVTTPQLSGRRVLLVEDSQLNQEVAAALLKEAGLSVEIAENGQAAVAKIAEAQRGFYDAVLMDIQMPIMDGYEATHQIRKFEADFDAEKHITHPRTPIIALTAHAMKGERDKCLAADMDDYIPKPLSEKELYRVLAKWLESPEKVQNISQGQQVAKKADEPSVIDYRSALKRLGGHLETYTKGLQIFGNESTHCVETISHHLAAGEKDDAMLIAHKVKGVAATVGAVKLGKVAEELEVALKKEGPETYYKIVHRLKSELKQAQEAIDALLRDPKKLADFDPPADTTPIPTELSISKATKRILLVDDDPAMTLLGKDMLEHLGYKVVVSTLPLNALSLFNAAPESFDLVITDLSMPEMDGDRLIHEILQIRKHLPTIICTGYDEMISADKIEPLGEIPILKKPFSLIDLDNLLQKVLNG